MLTPEIAREYYAREDIKHAIVVHATDKEIAIRFNDFFGKRPDSLHYPNDIHEAAKKGATSFHNSEERWRDPLGLHTGMKRRDQDDLRIGWDFILDIDCPIWEYSKMITELLIKALRTHGVSSISLKFSGNKGFHIGVPFEAFPQVWKDTPIAKLFPEAPKKVAQYLIDYINGPETEYELSKRILASHSIDEIAKISGKTVDELMHKKCRHCNSEDITHNDADEIEFICASCGRREKTDSAKKYAKCEACETLMEKMIIKRKGDMCNRCGSVEFITKFDPTPILEVDTLLISSRHMYRMPYSLHEKSGLVSLPFNPEKIQLFERKYADPKNVHKMTYQFLDTTTTQPNEAQSLLEKAWHYAEIKEESERIKKGFAKGGRAFTEREIEQLAEEIPPEFFPPCIQNILAGLEDGRKRALFILENFLSCTGYSWERIRELVDEWNAKNEEALRETIVGGQLRYHAQLGRLMLPPNCANKSYYQDLAVCKPDNLCRMIKNPVQYAKRKSEHMRKNNKKSKAKVPNTEKPSTE